MPAAGENKNKRVKKIAGRYHVCGLAVHQQQERQHPRPKLQASMTSRIKPTS
jgi:hypothetical protein